MEYLKKYIGREFVNKTIKEDRVKLMAFDRQGDPALEPLTEAASSMMPLWDEDNCNDDQAFIEGTFSIEREAFIKIYEVIED